MITAIVRFKLRAGDDQAAALTEIDKTIPLYQRAGPDLMRKQISIDAERGEGCSVYLWRSREAAEAFFAMAKAHIKAQTGHEPQVQLMETQVVVDNERGEVIWDKAEASETHA
jgi:uncharacterized protein YjcR